MAVALEDLTERARQEATRAGFRTCGIYHLLRALRLLEPDALSGRLAELGVDEPHFNKSMENVLRPRRAGGGIPRDRQDAALMEEAIAKANAVAEAVGLPANSTHLLGILADLEEDPILSLCDRYLVAHRAAAR